MRLRQNQVLDSATPLAIRMLPVISIAIGIFILDTITRPEILVTMLYVGVVLLSARFFPKRDIIFLSLGCMALGLLSYFLAEEDAPPGAAALANRLLSLAAIGITTFFAVQSQSRERVLSEQAGLLDLSHDTIFVRDMTDVIAYWNRGAEELYGWKKEEAVGKVTHQLMQTIFPQPLEDIMAELLRTGRWEGELVHTKKDGTQAVVASRWSVQRDVLGNAVAILETNNDITERRRAEEALQKAQAELAHVARVTTMGVLTSSIAHEVNQPLGAIVTNANAALRWLAGQPPHIDEARETLTRIIRDGHRAGEVIGGVRALLKKTATTTTRVELNALIQDTMTLVQGELRRHRILLRTELAEDLPPVAGDRVQLQQVILNLMMNGIEAMSAVTDRPRELLIRSRSNASGAVLVSVQDAGTGLDPQGAEQLFEAFYTTKAEGMGMGLAICRLIVEGHGGRLWASANEPYGAVFQFTLPSTQDETAPAQPAKASCTQVASPGRR
jgi:PAS domain S-box-containing protein